MRGPFSVADGAEIGTVALCSISRASVAVMAVAPMMALVAMMVVVAVIMMMVVVVAAIMVMIVMVATIMVMIVVMAVVVMIVMVAIVVMAVVIAVVVMIVVVIVMMIVVMIIVMMMMSMMPFVVGGRGRRRRRIAGRSSHNAALQRRTLVDRVGRNTRRSAGQNRQAFGGGRRGEHQQRGDGDPGHRREIQAGRATQLDIAHNAPLVMVNENRSLEVRLCASAPISLAGNSGYRGRAWRALRPAPGRFAPRD
jgi:hypothetical protein